MDADANTWERREGEDLAAYIARLEQVSEARLSPQQQAARRFYLRAAEEQREREQERRGSPAKARRTQEEPAVEEVESALERVKDAVRGLTPQDRQQLILWIARGMPPG